MRMVVETTSTKEPEEAWKHCRMPYYNITVLATQTMVILVEFCQVSTM
jgi:hypothetical protein